VVDNPAAYGLTNVTDRCYTGDDLNFSGGGEICPNPEDYLFWDGFHPTAVVHQVFAEAAYTSLTPPRHPFPFLLSTYLGGYLQQNR
jgi:phospholipase/lecithinase/hemolysin